MRLRFSWLSALVCLVGTLLAACDTATPLVPLTPPSNTALTSRPVPRGALLFGATNAGKATLSPGASPFGCFVSSPNASTSAQERYLHQAFYVSFPDSVVLAASGRTRFVSVEVGVAGRYTSAGDSVVKVREVRCVVPDHERAVSLVEAQAKRFTGTEGVAWRGETMQVGAASGGALAGKAQGWVTVYRHVRSCVYADVIANKTATEDGNCISIWRTEYVWVDEPSSGGGGGGGGTDPWGGGGGSSGGGGDRGGTGPLSEVCMMVSSPEEMYAMGCGPDDDPFGLEWPDWPQVRANELREKYANCSPSDVPPDVLEAGRVNYDKLFNMNVMDSWGEKMERIDRDGGFDGYNQFVFARLAIDRRFVTTIYEVKNAQSNYPFNDSDNNNGTREAKAHIDYLISQRDIIRSLYPEISIWLSTPAYVVVTTSPQPDLDINGEVVRYATQNHINVIRYQLKNRLGDWFFQGESLNMVMGDFRESYASVPTDQLPAWARDLFVKDKGFRVKCNPSPVIQSLHR